MGRDTQGNHLTFPPCNLGGSVWFETDGTPESIYRRVEESFGIPFEDDATEVGEYSYRSRVFGLSVRLKITTSWAPGVLCRVMAMTDSHLGFYDFEAPIVPIERHLAGLIEAFELGRLISDEEVRTRWDDVPKD